MAALTTSLLSSVTNDWKTAPSYIINDLTFSPQIFDSVTQHLICNPNLNSTHLFRADILFDSSGELKTPAEKEQEFEIESTSQSRCLDEGDVRDLRDTSPQTITGFDHKRTVVRRLIPRKPQLDKTIDQVCHFYEGDQKPNLHPDSDFENGEDEDHRSEIRLLIQTPRVSGLQDIPWYHPPLQALAFLYEFRRDTVSDPGAGQGSLSIHFLPFSNQISETMPERLHRTLLSLLSTYTRLARITPEPDAASGTIRICSSFPRDTLIPQHILQNTYTRLKSKYAVDLIAKWVEKTEPSKHVFEDLAIAAFLIELWRSMYTIAPSGEPDSDPKRKKICPGFVDLACGNGVLVYILLSEGYQGWGFDLRRRKTWSIFPKNVQQRLMEMICIPKPFQDVLDLTGTGVNLENVHDGIFAKDTFFISNHADELTPWTPLLAALSSPESPLPFLAIPCCSHALSGARHRYTCPKTRGPASTSAVEQDEQPASGDLKALKTAKVKAAAGDQHSTYATLTYYVTNIADRLGYDMEQTLMRIPSTRNVGLVGRKTRAGEGARTVDDIYDIVSEECARSGGIEMAARLWLERAVGLQRGPGRGKLKGGASHRNIVTRACSEYRLRQFANALSLEHYHLNTSKGGQVRSASFSRT